MAQKKLSKTRQLIHAEYEANELADLKQRQTRARSLSVGNAGGGVIEINMRGDFANLWFQMNPTEAIEIIGQLAAASGVEIAMRPRNDFASWRGWDTSLPASVHWLGTAPWQLSEEDRALLAEAKGQTVKKVEALEASDESESE
jgi:hypothetical protein